MDAWQPRPGESAGKVRRRQLQKPALTEGPGAQSVQVVLADDDPGFRSSLKRVMEANRRFRIIEACDGEEAVRLAREIRPDAVLMDLAMPRIDGLEATRIIKAEHPEVRVIICSVHNESVYLKACFVQGADGFLCKSRCFSELDAVEKLIEEGLA